VSLFRFSVTIQGADVLTGDAQDALFEAGCGDGTFGIANGTQTAEFDREAPDFAEAVASAIKAIEGAVPGARVVTVTRDSNFAATG
jgi:hypothetical protein